MRKSERLRELEFAVIRMEMNIDLIQMGVGGNDSWSPVAQPLAKYQIRVRRNNSDEVEPIPSNPAAFSAHTVK